MKLTKLDLLLISIPNKSRQYLTIGKWYVGFLSSPHNTIGNSDAFYYIRCDDGELRMMNTEIFITKNEYRETRLNSILE